MFSVGRLLSRRCHNMSSILQLNSCPSQNRTSGFPIHPAPRYLVEELDKSLAEIANRTDNDNDEDEDEDEDR